MTSDGFTAALDALERSGHLSERYAEPFVTFLPVTGASISTLGGVLGNETISASDAHAARLDEAQFDVGEGPCWDALRSAGPIAEPSLRTDGVARWPAFAAAVRHEPVSSIFAFPLIVGPLKLGAVDLYSQDPVALDAGDTQRAAALAEVIGRHILRAALATASADDDADLNPRTRRTVHQATGVVLAQLAISPDDALVMIQAHAFASGLSVMEVAGEIVEGTLRFRRHQGRIEVAP
jgi:hypothetical protein